MIVYYCGSTETSDLLAQPQATELLGHSIHRAEHMADAVALLDQHVVTAVVASLTDLDETEAALLRAWPGEERQVPLLVLIPAELETTVSKLIGTSTLVDYRLTTGLTATGIGHAVRLLRAAAEQARQQATGSRRLSELQTEYEQFAHLVAHDVSAPLRIVAKFLQLLEQRNADRLDEAGHEYLQLAVEHAEQAQAMIHELRRYSRIRPPEELVSVALGDLVDDILREWQDRLRETGVKVEVGPLPVLRGNLSHFDTLLRHLLDNAITYRQGETPTVWLEAEQLEDHILLTISDNGLGMDAHMAEIACQLFHRCHPDVAPGRGVGLAAARKIVTLYGGRLWLDSVENQGTTVYVSLPRDLKVSA